jgi:hypothetical protein
VIDATINAIPVQLGDVVSGPATGGFTNGRVKGISPCGQWLYIGWLGVVAIADCHWATDIDATKFARLYRPVAENRWTEAVTMGGETMPPLIRG